VVAQSACSPKPQGAGIHRLHLHMLPSDKLTPKVSFFSDDHANTSPPVCFRQHDVHKTFVKCQLTDYAPGGLDRAPRYAPRYARCRMVGVRASHVCGCLAACSGTSAADLKFNARPLPFSKQEPNLPFKAMQPSTTSNGCNTTAAAAGDRQGTNLEKRGKKETPLPLLQER